MDSGFSNPLILLFQSPSTSHSLHFQLTDSTLNIYRNRDEYTFQSGAPPHPSTRSTKKKSKAESVGKKKPIEKARKRSLTVTAKAQNAQKRQRQTSLAESLVPATGTSRELTEVAMNGAEMTGNINGQKTVSFNSLVVETSTTFLDTEALRIKVKRRQTPSSHSQFLTMSPSAKIVTIGIRRGPPSSVGSSINPILSASQHALLPKDFKTPVSQLWESTPLWFESQSSPLRFKSTPLHFKSTPVHRFGATEELQILTSQAVSTKSKPQYSSQSILGPGDLKVTAALETTCQMIEKYLLCRNPFPTHPTLLAVNIAITQYLIGRLIV